jgi:HPr kinase/phosphorylase
LADPTLNLHGTTVAWGPRAALILGASGRGKSALALQLMAWGAHLIADDRTLISRVGGDLIASCPPALAGLIEARGVGLLQAVPAPPCPVALVIDLDQPEPDRLPPRRNVTFLGLALPLLHNPGSDHFPAAILQYLKAGRREP